ncbi:amidase [Phaeobacter italicus]|uniref:amidase n=1 Tax=Phaeobacter italicus TaxID=481446 RepID=UPI001C937E58|nr:amidase [Phaeobacter italicus]MBY6045989.1 amidase [Phaeobacter italicus]
MLHLDQAIASADAPAARHVFLTRDDRGLRSMARGLDAQLAQGQQIGPLGGAVVVIKGNIDLAGMPTTAGSRSFAAKAADRSAPLVSRLVQAGGLPMGHANMSEFAFSGLGLNPAFGTPLNALNPDLVPGGSSSGCASAVALGIADLAVGTDTSGSTRVPAAYQGLYGFRPSMGRYEDAGILPLAPSLDTPGPIARDLRGILQLDTVLRQRFTADFRDPAKRVVIPDAASLGEVSSAVVHMLYDTASDLISRGWSVDFKPVPALLDIRKLFAEFGSLVAAEAPAAIGAFTALDNPRIDPNVRLRLSQGLLIDPSKMAALRAARVLLQADMRKALGSALLLMPTVPGPPARLADVATPAEFAAENARALSLTMPTAFLDMPSLAMPVAGRVPGQSLSLSASSGGDDRLLEAAERMAPVLLKMGKEH